MTSKASKRWSLTGMHHRQRKKDDIFLWKILPPGLNSVLALVLLVACANAPAQPTSDATPARKATEIVQQPVTPLPPDTVTITPDMPPGVEEFLRHTRPEELAKQADLIVLGSTVGPQVSGRLPPDSPLAPPEPPGEPAHAPLLYTETQVQVERTLKGTPPRAAIPVRTLGGTVDGQAMVVTHEPQLRADQRVVLFLKQIDPGYYTVLGEDGAYEIVDEEAIGPRHRFPLEELLTRIEQSTR